MTRPSYECLHRDAFQGSWISQAPTLPTITFNNDDGNIIASITVNEEGKLEIETEMDFGEAGKQSANVFWESFSYYLKEEWDKWARQNHLNT